MIESMEELTTYVSEKATEYWNETDDNAKIEKMPASVVDFVVEIATNGCPNDYDEQKIVAILSKIKTTLAMACIDVYAKAGMEGELSHSESGVSFSYESSWISNSLMCRFPNYVNVL
jgi:hypothetical protein